MDQMTMGLLTSDHDALVQLFRIGPLGETVETVCEVRAQSFERAELAPDLSAFLLIGNRHVDLWSASGEYAASLVGDNDPRVKRQQQSITGAGFSPDSTRMVTAAQNGTVDLEHRRRANREVSRGLRLTGSHFRPGDRPHRRVHRHCNSKERRPVELAWWGWRRLRTHGYKVHRVAFSPDGEWLVTKADNPSGTPLAVPEMWDRSGRRVGRLDGSELSVTADLHFDRRSRYVCLPGSTSVRYYDREAQRIGTLAGAMGTTVTRVAIAPDGAKSAVGFTDDRVRIWDYQLGRRVMTLDTDPAAHLAITSDGSRVLVATSGGPVRQYALDIGDLFSVAADRVDRGLTPAEVERFSVKTPTGAGVVPRWSKTGRNRGPGKRGQDWRRCTSRIVMMPGRRDCNRRSWPRTALDRRRACLGRLAPGAQPERKATL
jgi:WD40 repeat protein